MAERIDFICLWLNLLSHCKFNSPVVSRDWVTPIYESPINFGSNTTNFPTNQNSVITVTSEKVVGDDFLLHLYKYTSIIISDCDCEWFGWFPLTLIQAPPSVHPILPLAVTSNSGLVSPHPIYFCTVQNIVHFFSSVQNSVSPASEIFSQNVKSTQCVCTKVYQSVPKCTKVYQIVSECTKVYQCVPPYRNISTIRIIWANVRY